MRLLLGKQPSGVDLRMGGVTGSIEEGSKGAHSSRNLLPSLSNAQRHRQPQQGPEVVATGVSQHTGHRKKEEVLDVGHNSSGIG